MTSIYPLTDQADSYLEELAESLSVTDAAREAAERSYTSLGNWLCRDQSSVKVFDPKVYVQGSFALGTTLRPISEDGEYDLDSVCEFHALSMDQLAQETLKTRLGTEVEAYRKSRNMEKPLHESRRCWTLHYADEAKFHMDVVPALPNGAQLRTLLERASMKTDLAGTGIVITDNERADYRIITDQWPRSNPLGYVEWFKERIEPQLRQRMIVLAEQAKASVDEIPEYRVRTPLQGAIILLKNHRDMRCEGDACDWPISIILTTLAARAYRSEETIGKALATILDTMDDYIEQRGQQAWVSNPSDPFENFADKWAEFPEREAAFHAWLATARRDFAALARETDRRRIVEIAKAAAGETAVRRVDEAFRGGGRGVRAAGTAPAAGLAFPDTPRVPSSPRGFA
ncbi:MAG: nucleotidyltransferase [Brevundimonas sp.]|uniref:nucleotidyltransferase domain-containing protein n=1 Tax=Brevundimonas sp. TaxID=1871086 RepID=UPI0024889E0D|nr:nucleotidyltransferase [Brevundimonas sp.]MDI1328148.1 nucleotidyltransferase [Brevundimonas sp.]